MNLTVKGRKKLYLFDQNCVDNAILTRSADDTCLSEVGCNDCALGHKVTADVVRVCCVLCNGENLDLLDLSGLGVADVCELTAECADLLTLFSPRTVSAAGLPISVLLFPRAAW